MKNRFSKGSSNMEAIVILVVLFVIIFLFIIPAKKIGPTKGIFSNTIGPTYSSFGDARQQQSSTSYTSSTVAADSSYAQSISLGTGNAAYSIQPYEEYVTIDNYGNSPVNITGWSLKNGKGTRSYELGGTLQHYPADVATIPKAARFISPTGASALENVVLAPGDSAIVTTGYINVRSPYAITSFKENKCSGYLESMGEYTFTPTLNQTCINPANEPGIANLDVQCQNYIEGMQSCHVPKYQGKDSNGDACNNCVDGTRLSSSCVAFIQSHYNYSSCVYNHQNDPDFSSHTWRIFLGQGWEMWAADHETISLLDQFGKVVSSRSY